MTCIVALKHDGVVYMGADCAGSNGWTMMPRSDPKIYRVGAFLLGFTSSFRMGQLLGYQLVVPEHDPRVPVERFMVTTFIDAVRLCLKTDGFARRENETETGGVFLVAYGGRIFFIDDDYQVGESADDFYSVGCGKDVALGSLFSTTSASENPAGRLLKALRAAERFSAGVRGPFIVVRSDEDAVCCFKSIDG